jgi:hypothetical protein
MFVSQLQVRCVGCLSGKTLAAAAVADEASARRLLTNGDVECFFVSQLQVRCPDVWLFARSLAAAVRS